MADTLSFPSTRRCSALAVGTVVVIGLGYVGRPLAAAAAAAGFSVVGFDHDQQAARRAQHWWEKQGATGRLEATADRAALPPAEFWLICVPTPLDAQDQPDLSAVEGAVATIVANLAPGALVSLVSTCHPGATNGLIRPAIEAAGFAVGRDVFLCVSPERDNPGSPQGPRELSRLLGAPDAASLARAQRFWERLVARVIPVASPEIAECAKLLENAYRLVNIALIDELHRGFTALGVPTRAVIAAAATKPFGFAPFWPGAGAGGHCIPVDPEFLQMALRGVGAESRLLATALAANRQRPAEIVATLTRALGGTLKGRRILVMGVTYKPDVVDLRGAAPLALLRQIAAAGATALWHDPLLPAAPPELAPFTCVHDPAHCPEGTPDAVLVGTPHRRFDLDTLAQLAPLIVDPFGLGPPKAATTQYIAA